MAMRAVAMRLGAKRGGLLSRSLQSRANSGDGRVLSEEERVAENRYIKKMEQEKLEKAKQGIKVDDPAGSSSSSSSSSSASPVPGPSTDSSKNIAIFAGIAGILAVGIWFARSGTKKEEEKKA